MQKLLTLRYTCKLKLAWSCIFIDLNLPFPIPIKIHQDAYQTVLSLSRHCHRGEVCWVARYCSHVIIKHALCCPVKTEKLVWQCAQLENVVWRLPHLPHHPHYLCHSCIYSKSTDGYISFAMPFAQLAHPSCVMQCTVWQHQIVAHLARTHCATSTAVCTYLINMYIQQLALITKILCI